MNSVLIIYFISAILVIVAVAIFLGCMIYLFKNRHSIREEAERQEEARCNIEFYNVEIRASVIDQSCAVKTVGIKSPKTETVFTVVFQTEQEEILSFQVPEEMYEGLDVGQTGLLTIVDGVFYGFTPEENDI